MDARPARSPRRAFTLVEILVVMVIIGILAALITPAVISAQKAAKVAVIRSDITQLDGGLGQYKQVGTDYPPDCALLSHPDYDPGDPTDPITMMAQSEILRHVRRAFPRYVPGAAPGNSGTTAWEKLVIDVGTIPTPSGPVDLTALTPASALVFWLGGIPDGSSKRLMGFSAIPRDPFDRGEDANRDGVLDSGEDSNGNGALDWGPRGQKSFGFDETRLLGFDDDQAVMQWQTWPTYTSGGREMPYVYFKARGPAATGRPEYGIVNSSGDFEPLSYEHAADNICVPYLATVAPDPNDPNADQPSDPKAIRTWPNPEKYQLISAGLDDQFGDRPLDPVEQAFRFSTTGESFSDDGGDYNNITNFIESTLEDQLQP